jgi:hypothetical protein
MSIRLLLMKQQPLPQLSLYCIVTTHKEDRIDTPEDRWQKLPTVYLIQIEEER